MCSLRQDDTIRRYHGHWYQHHGLSDDVRARVKRASTCLMARFAGLPTLPDSCASNLCRIARLQSTSLLCHSTSSSTQGSGGLYQCHKRRHWRTISFGLAVVFTVCWVLALAKSSSSFPFTIQHLFVDIYLEVKVSRFPSASPTATYSLKGQP